MEYSGNRMSSQLPSIEEIKKLDVESLILRLNDANLGLSKDTLKFIKQQQIPGDIFLNLTLSCLKTYELKLGPAMRILQIINTLKKDDFKNKMGLHVDYNGDNISARTPSSEEIKILDADSLVLRLGDVNLRLNMDILYFLKGQEISGADFLELTHEDLFIHGLKLEPIKTILRAIQKINNEDRQKNLQDSNNSNLSNNYYDNEDNVNEMYICQECGDWKYCKQCNSRHFQDNFAHWTSGDSILDKFIQNWQLNTDTSWKIIEWIEYSNLENIELIAHGEFGSVYKAVWKDGPIVRGDYEQPWNINESKWERENKKEVAVKKLRNATNVSPEFLNEVDVDLNLNVAVTVLIYGVTCDPQSGEYYMFYGVAVGLFHVHDHYYLHKDFHSGNILNSIENNYINSIISYFGLCRPMDQSSADKAICSVLPFVAPEVLLGKEYTKAADIYGFGMIMYEVISGKPPFVDMDYDENLALVICSGQRPQIPEYTPEPYAALMERCWDLVPTNHPTALDVHGEIVNLRCVLMNISRTGIELDLKIKEAFNQEQENRWKERLVELATNPIPLKKSQNFLTSKRQDYSQHLSQKLTVEDWNKLKITD
ncbi:kinase-like domain-containing protein [Rhizophagus clarus]|uniref:Kinase-like domain-containing protein n=1 Tax=Rhizophagus clarus TaxID=94130 RepID=A0A8H3MF01_9GLOM|nr:kinase-like domain-containing protein [Rhizophagus clarus]